MLGHSILPLFATSPDTPCRWELIQNGTSTLLPHLSKARMLVRLLMPSLVGTSQGHAGVDALIAELETRLREAETSAGKSEYQLTKH
jgi:hypothetical protein